MYRFAKQIKEQASEVILFFSGGKDAIASLSVLYDVGVKVKPVFMYLAPDLRINETVLKWYEKKFSLQIDRIPHFDLESWADFFAGRTRPHKDTLKIGKVANAMRVKHKLDWVAYGMRAGESLQRRGMIKNKEVNQATKNCFPIAHWNTDNVLAYIKHKRLFLPKQYDYGLRDICGFGPEQVQYLLLNYPDDWQKLINYMPEFDRFRVQYGY